MGRGVPIPVNGGEVWRTSTVTKSGGLGDELIGNRVWSLTKTKKYSYSAFYIREALQI